MKTAVCLYVRDEVRNIAEWAAYHLEAGFDHLFIYDNGSVDGTRAVVEAMRSAGEPITVIPWLPSDQYAQYTAYDHCLYWAKGRFDWIAFFDIDEFLVLHNGLTLQEFLSDRQDCDGIAIHWAFFGSSGHQNFPDQPVIEAFCRRAPADFGPSRQVKSIVRPDAAIKSVSPHTFEINRGYQLGNRQPVEWAATGITQTAPDYSVCQLNHYFVRSEAHWSAKIARGYRDTVRSASEFAAYDRNEVEDLAASTAAPRVKARIARTLRHREPTPVVYPPEAFQFDPFYYAIRYPDVVAAGVNLQEHFWVSGLHENRDPNPFFDSRWYQSFHMAAQGKTGSAFIDFLSHGARHGYRINPS